MGTAFWGAGGTTGLGGPCSHGSMTPSPQGMRPSPACPQHHLGLGGAGIDLAPCHTAPDPCLHTFGATN